MRFQTVIPAMVAVVGFILLCVPGRANIATLESVGSGALAIAPGEWEGYVALHFLGDAAAPAASQHIRRTLAEAPRLAGIRHVFVLRAGDEPPAGLSPTETAHLRRERDDRAAAAWGVEARPTLVVLRPDGSMLFRESAGAYPNFRTITAQVEMRWRDPALGHYWISGGVAAGGFDTVGMVDNGRAERGRATFASSWQGLTYHFASAENRDAFARAPWRYVPRYGGWCATSIGDGELIEPDPANFLISGDRLLLFSDGMFGNARDTWQADSRTRSIRAEEAWAERRGVLLRQ